MGRAHKWNTSNTLYDNSRTMTVRTSLVTQRSLWPKVCRRLKCSEQPAPGGRPGLGGRTGLGEGTGLVWQRADQEHILQGQL